MSVAFREAFYVCKQCSASSWRLLTGTNACRDCCTVLAPVSEEVLSETIIGRYDCTRCDKQWTTIYTLRKDCGACGSSIAAPTSQRNIPIGVTFARCTACNATAYEPNGALTDVVMCRSCNKVLPAAGICSPRKFSAVSARINDPAVCAELARAFFLMPIQRRRAVNRPSPLRASTPQANPFAVLVDGV